MKITVIGMGALALVGLCGTANAELAYGLTFGGSLVSFDTATPGASTAPVALSGMTAGHVMNAIDFRPATGQLYALSASGLNVQLYTVNLGSGVLTPVGAGFTMNGGFATTRTLFSIDFNPTVDRIRIVSRGNGNARAHPVTGALVGTGDTLLAYDGTDPAAGTAASISGVAYTNNFPGATSTTLYGWDYNVDRLVTIGGVGGTPSPNTGLMFSVNAGGPLLTGTAEIGMDISAMTGTAFLSFDDFATGAIDQLASIDLATGALTPLGVFTEDMLDISVVIPAPSALGLAGVLGLGLLRRNRRA